jgi:hypothetical protein
MMVRRMNKAMKPSKVLCEDTKTIKKLKINCLGLCFTIFSEKVTCTPHELRLYIRERFQTDKSYGSYNELILNK